MAAHHAKARYALLPTGAPVSSARRLSTTAVNGWFAANQRTPAGIESAGTKVLDRNGSRNDKGRVEPFAPATLFVTRPMAADSQAIANEKTATIPTTANQSATDALGRNPSMSATPVTATVATSMRRTLTPTWPARSAPRVTAIVRIRSTKPPVMSMVTLIAVGPQPPATVITRMPATR